MGEHNNNRGIYHIEYELGTQTISTHCTKIINGRREIKQTKNNCRESEGGRVREAKESSWGGREREKEREEVGR